MKSKAILAVLLILLCVFTKNGFSAIYKNKGLKGLRSFRELSEQEREDFKRRKYWEHPEAHNTLNSLTEENWSNMYDNNQFREAFDVNAKEDLYRNMPKQERDAMYRSRVINKALENEFGRETEEIQIIQSLNLSEKALIGLLEFENDDLLSQIYAQASIKRLESGKDVIQGMVLYTIFKEKKPFDDKHISKDQMVEWLADYYTLEEHEGITVARRYFGRVLHDHIANCQTWYYGWLCQTMCNLVTEVLELVINPFNMIRALKTEPHYRLTMTCIVTGRDANGHKLDGWDWTNPNCLEFARGAGSMSPNYLLKIKQYNECRW